jgi:hypothetical protein
MFRVSRLVASMAGLLLVSSVVFAKDKQKATLPYYVLQARTVAVVIDPNAGISPEDPQANQVAQRDVETALLNWGRFQTTLAIPNADLVIVIRRGTGKMASGTIHDPYQNRRPVAVDPTNTGIDVGIQKGQPAYPGELPDASQGSAEAQTQNMPGGPISNRPYPQTEVGSDTSEDSFLVYRGRTENPADSPPVWRIVGKDCLKPHKVPAVEAFRKVISDTEQAAANQP